MISCLRSECRVYGYQANAAVDKCHNCSPTQHTPQRSLCELPSLRTFYTNISHLATRVFPWESLAVMMIFTVTGKSPLHAQKLLSARRSTSVTRLARVRRREAQQQYRRTVDLASVARGTRDSGRPPSSCPITLLDHNSVSVAQSRRLHRQNAQRCHQPGFLRVLRAGHDGSDSHVTDTAVYHASQDRTARPSQILEG